MEDPTLNVHGEVVKMRPSQRKFRMREVEGNCFDSDLQTSTPIASTFGVVDHSKPYQFGALNKFTIIVLSGLGVPFKVFEARQQEFFQKWTSAMCGEPQALFHMLLLAKKPELLQNIIEKDLTEGPGFLQDVKKAFRAELKKMTGQHRDTKLRIPIEKSRLLFGVADTTATLRYGECFLHLENLDVPPAAQVLVTRSPCYHPGDIRVLRPMLVSDLIARAPPAGRKLVEQQLAVLHDVIVFPTDGPRPHPDEMQGGDLDGDEFFVCWDPELLPRLQVDAAGYAATNVASSTETATLTDLAVHFAYFSFVATARVSEAWLHWASTESDGAMSSKCRRLTDFFSRAVDAVSSGEAVSLPAELQKPLGSSDETETRWWWYFQFFISHILCIFMQ